MKSATIVLWGLLLGGPLALTACGSVDTIDAPGSSDDNVLPPGVPLEITACGAPKRVTEGYAWVGPMELTEGWELQALSCGTWVPTGSLYLKANAFYLDEDEVTNACYRACVDAGSCSVPAVIDPSLGAPGWGSPEGDRYPAIVTAAQAQELCTFRKGRLPSVAELVRASHGDKLGIGTTELFAAYVSCSRENYVSNDCKALVEHLWSAAPVYPIRWYDADVGPFGHRDLVGGMQESTMTWAPLSAEELSAYCAIEHGAKDPKTFGSTDELYRFYFTGAGAVDLPVSFDKSFPWIVSEAKYDPENSQPHAKGARCVYDVVPP